MFWLRQGSQMCVFFVTILLKGFVGRCKSYLRLYQLFTAQWFSFFWCLSGHPGKQDVILIVTSHFAQTCQTSKRWCTLDLFCNLKTVWIIIHATNSLQIVFPISLPYLKPNWTTLLVNIGRFLHLHFCF